MGVLCVALVIAFVVTAVMALAVPLSRRLVVHSLAVFLHHHLLIGSVPDCGSRVFFLNPTN